MVKRWAAHVEWWMAEDDPIPTYVRNVAIDEIEDLGVVIESGPDWTAMPVITITLKYQLLVKS